MTVSTKLWRTIKGIDGKSKRTAENEGITFTGRPHTSSKLIANSFNRQFTTSKLGKHSLSRRTRHVSKDVKRMSLEVAESFTNDQVTSVIKISGSSLPSAITRWLSYYLRVRQAATSFRGTKSSTRIVRTDIPQVLKLSPSLFNYCIANMPKQTPPVKRVCYADDITGWATGPNIIQLESMINSHMR